MMLKYFSSEDWNWDIEPVALVKRSSAGRVTGRDRSVLLKRAGDDRILQRIARLPLKAGEEPIHVIALGASQWYGPNRKGDAFRQEVLQRYHDTFTTHARHYRHHQNTDPAESYGIVKAAWYNDRMHRVELLVALNATEEAARRNGGKVADWELNKLASSGDFPVSMACRVSYDVCSGCGNRARTREDYCDEDRCPYGGCKKHMAKVAYDGHLLHVDNPDPVFVDISTVIRPADRTAYAARADWHPDSGKSPTPPPGDGFWRRMLLGFSFPGSSPH